MSLFEYFDRDLFGFSGYNAAENEIIVSFRGTNGLDFKNWGTNFQTNQIAYQNVTGAMVHSGWY